MKILNFHWGFSTGGIGKCFLTYDKLGDVEPNLRVYSICVVRDPLNEDLSLLKQQGIHIVHIQSNADFSWMKEVRNVVKEFNPDYFFAHGHNAPVFLYLLSLRYCLNIPFICTVHGYNVNRSNRKLMMYHHAWIWVLKKKFVKKIICVEKITPKILANREHIDLNKIVTVYNGIKPELTAKPIDLSKYSIDGPIIITASRLVKLKGLNYLLEALCVLKKRDVKFHYFMIGNGEEENALREQAKILGLTDKEVTFIGYQSNVSNWLATCDVFALPSLEEAHSIGILEAMRAKKAIVATNIGGNPESLRNDVDAILVDSKNAEQLANALEKVLLSNDYRIQLGQTAYKRFLSLFTEDKMKGNLAQEIMSCR